MNKLKTVLVLTACCMALSMVFASCRGVVVSNGTFRIVTGTVYGSNASPTSLRNTVTTNGNDKGTALSDRCPKFCLYLAC